MTYGLRIIVAWLQKNDFVYEPCNGDSPGRNLRFQHGVWVRIAGDFDLSVQTHTDIVCTAFAETALLFKKQMIPKWDALKWNTPEALFEDFDELRNRLKDYVYEEEARRFVLADGSVVKLDDAEDGGC